MRKILLAEDDPDFADVLRQYLTLHDYEVQHTRDGEEALALLKLQTFDICILDVMMPKIDGFMLAAKITDLYPDLPFVFLTARQLKEDRLKGLHLGADDYIVKPFEADELVLRLQNIIRRTENSLLPLTSGIVGIGSFDFDLARHELRWGNSRQQLTAKEAALLAYLNENRNLLLKREIVLTAVWGSDDFFSGRSMDVFISRLRKYLAADKSIAIISVRNIGLEFKVRNDT